MPWTEAILCTDDDLTAYESKMPSLAKSIKRPGTTSTPYDGKRELAKRDIATRLVRMGVVLDELTADNITSLCRTAVYRELSLIFRDMADRNDAVSTQKANYYNELFDDSWQDVVTALAIPQQQTGIGFIPAYRA